MSVAGARLQPWWARRLCGVYDPISLEPLDSLKYPPIELCADLSQREQSRDFFNSRMLAAYLVSTFEFVHPVTHRNVSVTP